MASESSEKRGRGRPKGSLNKATVAKQEQMREATTLDVSFESAEEVPVSIGEPVSMVEPEEPEEPPEPKPKRKARKPKVPELAPEEEVPAEVPESPVRKARKPRAKPRDPEPPEPPLTYLQALQRGLQRRQLRNPKG